MDEALSVSQVNKYLKLLIDGDDVLQQLYVRGELSNYKRYPSGHHYFTLKDSESVLKCVFFRGDASRLSFAPADGMKVIAAGRLSVFPRDGAVQLYCSRLLPDGVGALSAAFEQLKEKLSMEGLFDAAHKKPLPRFPERVVLITSPAGAAVRDMIRIFRRRWPLCRLILAPVRVQGEEAPGEIVSALRYVNKKRLGDVIITGRGGGSLEDLWAFNDENVARAIFASVIPVVSAVGHEPDVTISDFVADVRASTPSHAAELVAPDQAEWAQRLAQTGAYLRNTIAGRLERAGDRLSGLSKAFGNPMRLLDTRRQLADIQYSRMCEGFNRLSSAKRERFLQGAARLDALSPLKVLSRGYSLAFDGDGGVIKDSSEVGLGDAITVRPEKGKLYCRVERVEA